MTARVATKTPVHWGEYPDWLNQAAEDGITPACRGRDLGVFFLERGGNAGEAKAVCHTCPLERTCRAWALQQPARWLYGVWGGLTQYERIALAEPGQKPASLRKHNR